jgi:4-hydroxybenzoate polyprenyltransferase/phosphoserine phosphatase
MKKLGPHDDFEPNSETKVGVRQPEFVGPLVVDLDETLVQTNLLLESLFAYISTNPFRATKVLGSFLQGRAQLKADVARDTPIDAALLPYNEHVLSLIEDARNSGCEVYLASTSNERYVEAVARHLSLFDGWFGSTDTRNLTGSAKADLLVDRFGPRGFDYLGNGRADLAIWSVARGRVALGTNGRVVAALKRLDPTAYVLPTRTGGLLVWSRLFRVHQWTKNGLVFVPLFAAHLFTIRAFASAFVAAIAFSLVASAIYIVNDLVDIEADRKHRSKKNRPLAAGTAPVGQALIFAIAFLAIALGLGLLLPVSFTAVLAAYLATSTAYSFHLKRKLMLDVIALAGLYTLRVIGGVAAVSTVATEWILAFSMFVFTSLALLKRYVELAARLDASLPDLTNRDYKKTDLPVIGALSAASGMNAVTVFALYISSDNVHRLYRHPKVLWLVCPILLYWIGRAIVLAERRLIDEDPILFALRDRASLLAFVAIAAIMIAAA